jgi:hypothetical protein
LKSPLERYHAVVGKVLGFAGAEQMLGFGRLKLSSKAQANGGGTDPLPRAMEDAL